MPAFLYDPHSAANKIHARLVSYGSKGLDGSYFSMMLNRPDMDYREKHEFTDAVKAILLGRGFKKNEIPDMRITLTLSSNEFMGFVSWQ